jgi:hypothetical protein
MAFVEEFDPISDLKTLLENNWVDYAEAPQPHIQIVNDVDDAVSKADFSDTDYVFIKQDSQEQERYRGNVTYHDLIFPMEISITTKVSRQRMRNLYKEIRSICLINKHLFPNYQFLHLMTGCTEMVEVDLNIWRGDIRLQVENHAILCETSI